HNPSNIERYVQCKITKFGQEKLLLIYDVTRFQHLEQMRKDFVANVSHELRTPLTVIMGYVETLSEQPELDPRIARAFTQMMQQSQRMNNIINDLLLLSRLENDEKPAEPKDIDIPKMLMQLFDDAQMYNKSYDHMIHLHIDSTLHILGYEDYLRSALSNLITNAMKYTPKGGEISISWHEYDAGVCFSVTDNGIGIEQRHIQRLTERFYRVDTGRSRETGGTGLGLAIVKHVLYQHHATLDITSTVGKGSTFTVTFPKSASIPTQSLNPASPQS
ncbi:phosphate regulon sensor histidine kinase PhoR, partial [Mesorhizobium sp. BR1-1-5]|nr:phosphate regulon sensor histidine kinase PhoR [Mesorhizobium sp. BR1-1-5]